MKREHGLAAVTAILVVAVAASAAALMLAQQSAMLDQVGLVTARVQADAYAHAGLDWARGVLAEDARRNREVDSLDEGWAQPIAALPIERAVVSGAIEDEQGKLNLNALVNGTAVSERDVRAFQALLESLDLPVALADAVRDWVDADADLAGPGGAEDPYYLSLPRPYRAANRPMVQVEELYRVRGFDARTVARLRPYVTALPARAPLNANTASDAVLAATLGISREKAATVVAARRTQPFRSRADLAERLRKLGIETPAEALDVRSGFFFARVQVAQDEVRVATEALLRRDDAGATAIIWRRPRY